MKEKGNSQYEIMLEEAVGRLCEFGVEINRVKEIVQEAADQYYMNGRYRKSEGVNEEMHVLLRSIVKPYALSVAKSNQRRGYLIDKEFGAEGLDVKEKEELDGLQKFVLDFVNHVAPLPIAQAKSLLSRLVDKNK